MSASPEPAAKAAVDELDEAFAISINCARRAVPLMKFTVQLGPCDLALSSVDTFITSGGKHQKGKR